MRSDTWVVGIGNPLRGDDGVGWAVVEVLADLAIDSIQTVCVHQLLPELLDSIYVAERVIFVDARANGEPGRVMVTSIQPTTDGPASSHQLHPAVLLAMGVKLYGRMPSAKLITITGQDFGYQENLSPPVQKAIAEAVQQIEKFTQAKEPVL